MPLKSTNLDHLNENDFILIQNHGDKFHRIDRVKGDHQIGNDIIEEVINWNHLKVMLVLLYTRAHLTRR